MKKKGFTLIELLAVIVILAIIALIATPIILNIISDSREESNKRSVELYGKAVEQAIAKSQLNGSEIPAGYYTTTDGKTLTKDDISFEVQYSGNAVTCTTNKLYEDGSIYLADCTVNGNKVKGYIYGTLKPGAYDNNNNLIADWDTLVSVYGIDVSKDYNPGNYKIANILKNEALKNITKIVIPDSVESIGDWAFYNCTSLESVTIPDSVESIGSGAFEGCTSLKSVTIPDSVESIGSSAFKDCTSLTNATIGSGITRIDYDAFSGCTSLKNVIIPDSVEWVATGAFRGCTSLESVIIGTGVDTIDFSAFSDCTNITSAVFKDPNGWILYNMSEGTRTELPPLTDPSENATYLVESSNFSLSKS